MLTMSYSSDLGYITIVKNQAKLNSEGTRDGNTDLPAEGDLPNTHTPHTQNKVMCVCEIPTVLKSTTAGCLQNNKAGPCYFLSGLIFTCIQQPAQREGAPNNL